VNVKLTKQQRDYIKAKLKTGQYSDASEVVREAMRTQAALEARREGLEQAIEDGVESGPAELADNAWWKALDAELEKAHGRRRRRAA
jgi:antitoxin ParD1/3/4